MAVRMEVFTEEWARACCQALNRSEAYKASAATWEGEIILQMSADPAQGVGADRSVYIDTHRGECRRAHVAGEDEIARAAFAFRADPATWKRLLAREVEPVAAIMQGRLRLVRGNLFALAKYSQAAKDMVSAAGEAGGTFPGDVLADGSQTGA
jgi:putative sterol carrier protein